MFGGLIFGDVGRADVLSRWFASSPVLVEVFKNNKILTDQLLAKITGGLQCVPAIF